MRLAVRLGLVLVLLVAGPLAVVYFSVVPSLQDRLVHSKVVHVQNQVGLVAHLYTIGGGEAYDARALSGLYAPDRVVVYQSGQLLRVFDDSNSAGSSQDIREDPIAQEAERSGKVVAGTVVRAGDHYAEAAKPVFVTEPRVVLISVPIQSELDDIQLVQQRILVAGAAALIAALIIGFAAATLHVRRIRRLERAADRIAHGDFEQPVIDPGHDELGDLATAFEHMRRRLAALDDARREFVANASHELRTPIFALGAALELLEDEELDAAERDEFLETMRDQVRRLTRMTADLLDLTRLDAGRMPVQAEAVDLAATAEVLAREFDAAARAGGHTIELRTNGAAHALADSDQVLRIGRAVVENALVHTPPGTNIEIAVQAYDGRAVLEVADDGPGVPPSQREQVFERFYRGEGTRASGSGLGLAIAHELAELMNGELELYGDNGTRIRLVLPADKDA
jgi:signal transduction histidine kinase